MGLSAGEQVTLRLNGTETINVPFVNGYDSFWFTTALNTGENYNVQLIGQTTLKTCSPGGNVGTVVSSNVTSVLVNCVASVAGTPGVTVFPVAALTTSEGASQASFGVWLDAAPTANVVIPISSSDATEGTVSVASLTFTSLNWSTPQVVTLTGQNDWVQDGNVVYTAVTGATTSTDANYNGTINPPDVTITNLDNDTSGVFIAPATGLMVTEAAGSGNTNSFTVVLTSAPLLLTTATISLTSSNLGKGTVAPASLVFDDTNWNIPQTVTITGVDNLIADGNQVFSIVTGNIASLDPWYSGMVVPDVSVTSIDNETFGITVLAGSSTQVSESGTTSSFEILLNSQPTANVSFGVSTSNSLEGTIIAPFAGASGTLTFTSANWNVPQTVTIQGVADLIADGNQPFNIVTAVAVSADPNYNGINPADVAYTNVDQDVAGVLVNNGVGALGTSETATSTSFSVVLKSKPTASVTINPTITDATEGTFTAPFVGTTGTLTFTTGNWNIPQTLTVQGVDDLIADGNVSYNVTFSASASADPVYNGTFTPAPITVANIDNETAGVTVSAGSSMLVSESGASSSFTVVLNSQPAANVTMAVSTSNALEGTISAPFVGSAGTLTFTAANWNVPQTVTVQGVPDFAADGNQPFTIVIAATASADAVYNGTFNPPDVAFTNVDQNKADVTVMAGTSMLVSESGTTSTFSVVLNSQPASNVTIGVSTSNSLEGTIISPFIGAAGTLTFTTVNWNVPQMVRVQGVADAIADGNQLFTIVLAATASLDPVYNGTINPIDVSYTNADVDTAGVIVNKGTASLVTSETGTTTTFSVVLQSKPAANVTINPTIADATEGAFTAPFAGATGTLTFTPANYNIPQTLTVQGIDDLVADANIAYNITFSATASTDANYNATFTPLPVPVINTDNETKGITVNIGNGLMTSETGTTATIWVSLNSQPTANVTIGGIGNIASNTAGTEVNVSPVTLIFTAANWSTPQAVTLTPVDDFLVDGMKTSTISFGTTVSADANYNALTPASVTAYNLDNETSMHTVVIIPAGGNTTSEGGTTLTYKALLSGPPPCALTLGGINSSDMTEGTVSPASLNFNGANWNIPQNIVVTGQSDLLADGNILYTVNFGSTAGCADPNWNGLLGGSVALTNTDYWTLATNYIRSLPAGTFTSISATGTVIPFGFTDDDEFSIPIGFTFKYLDPAVGYTNVQVGTNGYLTFDTGFNVSYFAVQSRTNSGLFTAGSRPNLVLAPWWGDMDLVAGAAYYQVSGVAPNRILTVEWKNNQQYFADDTFNYQVKLYETTNVIDFVYGPKTNVDTLNNSFSSMGISDAVGGNTHFRDAFDGTNVYTTNASRSYTNFPVANTVIRFTP